MRVALYCRIATATQKDMDDFAIQSQQHILIQYANQNKLEIIKIYSDIGYKGHDLMRPGFFEMLKDAQQGLFDAILVKNPDRLFRGNSLFYSKLSIPVICTDLQNIKKEPQNDRDDR